MPLFFVMFLALLCPALVYSQDGTVDTVYTDTHKVTYVINTAKADGQAKDANAVTPGAVVPENLAPKDSLGISAPPNKRNRFSFNLIAQNLNFAMTYERLLTDFWSLAVRLSYAGFDESDLRSYTDGEGTINAISTPMMLRWYWGRRNLGKYRYVGPSGKNYSREQKQVEGFLQLQVSPVFYNVDLDRDTSSYKEDVHLRGKEYGLYATLGLGGRYCYEHFFWGSEISIGRFIRRAEFQDELTIYSSRYGTRLLDKIVAESILFVGWMF